jgi:hypothetical protein
MTGPIETAYVEILPKVDASKFSKTINEDVEKSLKSVPGIADKAFEQVEKSVVEASEKIEYEFDNLPRTLKGTISRASAEFKELPLEARLAVIKLNQEIESGARKAETSFSGVSEHISKEFETGTHAAETDLKEMATTATVAGDKVRHSADGAGAAIAADIHKGTASAEASLLKLKNLIAGTFLIGGAYAGFQFLKEGALDSEEASSGLRVVQNLLKQAGDEANLSLAKIKDFATDQSFKIGVDDDDILAAGRNLVSLKGITQDTFERASAAGADLAATLGKGLVPTTKSLAKALGDPTKAAGVLAKANVFLTETQKDNIAALVEAGKVDQARGKILDLVEGKVQGAAEKSATSTQKIGTAFAELRETIGGGVTKVIDKVAPKLVGFFTGLQNAGPGISAAFSKLADIFVPLFAELGSALADIAPKIQRLAGDVAPLALALAAIGTIVATKVLPYLGQLVDGISSTVEFITNLVSGSSALQTVLLAVGGAIGTIVIALKVWAIVTKALTAVQAALNVVMDANPIGLLVLALAGLVAGLVIAYKRSETFRNIVDAVGNALKVGFTAAVNGVQIAIGFVVDVFQRLGDKLLFLLGPIGAIIFAFRHWDEIKAIVGDVIDAVVGFFTGLGGRIGAGLNAAWEAVKGFTVRVSIAVASWVVNMVQKFNNLLLLINQTVANGLVQTVAFFASLPGKAVNALSSLTSRLRAVIANAASSMADRARDLVENIADIIRGLPDKISAVGSKMLAAGKELIGKLFDGIKSAVSGAGGFAADIAQSIKSAINSTLHLPFTIKGPGPLPDFTIPAFADGGIIDKDTIARIGESGREVVIPLTRARRAVDLATGSGLFGVPGMAEAYAKASGPLNKASQSSLRGVPTLRPSRAALPGSGGSQSPSVVRERSTTVNAPITVLAHGDPEQHANQLAERLASWSER